MTREYDEVYKEARKAALKRDKKKCRFPGCKCRKRLQVHHIVKWSSATSLRYEVDNLITLCKQHHEEITGVESHYVDLFLSIIKARQ